MDNKKGAIAPFLLFEIIDNRVEIKYSLIYTLYSIISTLCFHRKAKLFYENISLTL